MITAIVCMDRSNCIGVGDTIPWDCPSDRKFFKDYVKGKWKVVGAKTWETIKDFKWARERMIVCHRSGYNIFPRRDEEYLSITSGRSFLQNISECVDEPVIIGGAEIYRMAAPYVDQLIVTRIDRITCNPANAIIFPWSTYLAYNWKEEIYEKLEEDVTVYKLTKT